MKSLFVRSGDVVLTCLKIFKDFWLLHHSYEYVLGLWSSQASDILICSWIFAENTKKMLPSCSSYYIFFFVFLSYFWFMIFFDVMVTSRNVLLYFLPFFVAFWFYSAHEKMFTSLILEMSLVNDQWYLPLGQFTIHVTRRWDMSTLIQIWN